MERFEERLGKFRKLIEKEIIRYTPKNNLYDAVRFRAPKLLGFIEPPGPCDPNFPNSFCILPMEYIRFFN